MNKQRRSSLEQAKDIIQIAMDDEQAAFDNLPDSIRDSERGQQMEGFIYNMDEAVSNLSEILEA